MFGNAGSERGSASQASDWRGLITATKAGLTPATLWFAVAALSIIAFAVPSDKVVPQSGSLRLTAATGLKPECYRMALPVFHLYGLFPAVVDRVPPHILLRDRPPLDEVGTALRTEWGHCFRYGETGVLSLYLPTWWLSHATVASVRPVTATLWIGALLLLALRAAATGWGAFGCVLVAALAGNGFQRFEAFQNEDVFSLPITFTCFALALNARAIRSGVAPWGSMVASAITIGVLGGAVSHVRPEPALVLAGVAAFYLLALTVGVRKRLVLATLLLCSAVLSELAIRGVLDTMRKRTEAAVAAAGGKVYQGPTVRHHPIWHAVWCGLGDFGKSHGYRWRDEAAYAALLPKARERAHEALIYEGGVRLAGSWDEAGTFYQKPEDFDEYLSAARSAVVSDVLAHPMWYAGVLVKRAGRLLFESSPIEVPNPIDRSERLVLLSSFASGWMTVAVLITALLLRANFFLRIFLIVSPLGLTSLLIYSGGGTIGYAIFNAVSVAAAAAAVINAVRRRSCAPCDVYAVPRHRAV